MNRCGEPSTRSFGSKEDIPSRLSPDDTLKAGGRSTPLRRTLTVAAALLLALMLAHAGFITPLLHNGDAAVYNDQIEQGIVGTRTTHIGYILLGIGANAVSPLPTDMTMNLLCALLGFLGVAALGLIAWRFWPSWAVALAASLAALAVPSYLKGTFLSEVDVPGWSLTLMALAAWVWRRPAVAGVLFGWAMLVTPLSALSLPWFLALFPRDDGQTFRLALFRHFGRVLRFALTSLAVYLPLVMLHHQDYLFGGRGVLHAPRLPFSFAAHLARSAVSIKAEGLWQALLFLPVAVAFWRLHGWRRHGDLALAILASALLTVLIGERFNDIPVQVPNLLLAAVCCATALSWRSRAARWIAAVVLAALIGWQALGSYAALHRSLAWRAEERARFLAIRDHDPTCEPWVVGFGDTWNEGLPFERYVYGRTKLRKALTLGEFKGEAARRIRDGQERPCIWFLAKPPETPGVMKLTGYRSSYLSVEKRRFLLWKPGK